MKPQKSSHTIKAFEDLELLFKAKSAPPPVQKRQSPPKKIEIEQNPVHDEELLRKAMEGVKPISRDNYVERTSPTDPPEGPIYHDDIEALSKLKDLVRYGTGFNVCDTPEYIEGTGYHVHTEIARRLHQGVYSIQAFIDLHGLVVEDAKEVFDKFLKWAVTQGKTGILIIHGRGLSSPAEPVLKKKVVEWLTRGIWRKWVMAYSSARACDGGAGATYVLLRPRAISKRMKIRRIRTENPYRKEEEKQKNQ
jgi:DNA-nicking Smr family endonuclease